MDTWYERQAWIGDFRDCEEMDKAFGGKNG